MSSKKIIAIKINHKDNVATIFNEVVKSSKVVIKDIKGNTEEVSSKNDIPYGHKIAIENISKGDKIIKYGEIIGAATEDLSIGEYVHVHNLESIRGRGDWQKDEVIK